MAIETAVFIGMLAMAVAFTFMGFKILGKASGFLNIIAMALWLGLAIFTGAGEEVSAISTENRTTAISNASDGSLITFTENRTSTTVLIQGGEETVWLSFLFTGFAMLNIFLFVRNVYWS